MVLPREDLRVAVLALLVVEGRARAARDDVLQPVVFAALGFIPAYLVSLGLKKVGLLRIPPEVEEQGLDLSEVPATPYPEGIPVTVMRTNGSVLVVTEEVK